MEKLSPAENIHLGCLNCSMAAKIAPMAMVIAVGFGDAFVTKDGQSVYSEDRVEGDKFWVVQDAENLAVKEPDCDWRIVKYGPMHCETFQRQGTANWVCVDSNEGFA